MKRFLGLASCACLLTGLTLAGEARAQPTTPAGVPPTSSPGAEPAAEPSGTPGPQEQQTTAASDGGAEGVADAGTTNSEAASPVVAGGAATASGDGGPSESTPQVLPVAVPGPLLLEVEGAFSVEEKEALKAALVRELGCLVLEPDEEAAFAFRGVVRVRADETSQALTIVFEDEAHEVSERTLESPPSKEGRERTIVFVVGSLARSALSSERVAPAPPAEPPLERQFAHASLYYPLSTNYGKPNIHTHLGFNLVYGRVGLLEGFSLGTVQVATRGVQGLELALGANVSMGKAEGFQVALVANLAKDLDGAQLALGANVADDVRGGQASLGANVADDVRGGQASLGANVADDVRGAQIGLVNHAGKVRGVQLGLVNVSEDVEGVPIGVVSVSKKGGGVHPLAWYSNHSYVNVGLKFATRYTYTFVNLAWNTDDYLIGPGFGIGGSLPIWKEKLFADLDLSQTMLMPESGAPSGMLAERSQYLSRLRLLARYQFFKHLGVFAGGGLTVKVEREFVQNDFGNYEPGDFAPNALGEVSAGAQF